MIYYAVPSALYTWLLKESFSNRYVLDFVSGLYSLGLPSSYTMIDLLSASNELNQA